MKKKTEPTFEERFNAASAAAAAATSVFDKVAADLEQAARDKEIVAQDIEHEITRLEALVQEYRNLQFHADMAASGYYNKAASVRALVGN